VLYLLVSAIETLIAPFLRLPYRNLPRSSFQLTKPTILSEDASDLNLGRIVNPLFIHGEPSLLSSSTRIETRLQVHKNVMLLCRRENTGSQIYTDGFIL
jgi:hypothetical protein